MFIKNQFMVTCKLLGRTGNQMFQIAAVIGYAKKHGLEYHIPAHTQNDEKWKPMFTHLENKNYNPALPKIQIEESGFAFNHLPAPPFKDCNIELSGYFQSHKYFDHCLEDVRKAFNIPYNRQEGWTAIHIRLGDYRSLPDFHPVVTKEYLLNAVNLLIENGCTNFVIFSDDMPEASNILNSETQPDHTLFDFSRCKFEKEDLSLGSSCDNIIGSNSSFSLWMYYLNPNPDKISIFPKRWFGPKLPHDTKDLYPENCIIL